MGSTSKLLPDEEYMALPGVYFDSLKKVYFEAQYSTDLNWHIFFLYVGSHYIRGSNHINNKNSTHIKVLNYLKNNCVKVTNDNQKLWIRILFGVNYGS